MVLVGFWRHKRLDEIHVTVNSITDYLLPDYSVEEHIKFNDHPLQMVGFISFFFSHKKSIFLFEYVLNFTDDVGSPNNLPVFFGIH